MPIFVGGLLSYIARRQRAAGGEESLAGRGMLFDKGIPEQRACGLAGHEPLGRFVQCRGQTSMFRVFLRVGVADDGGIWFDAMLDTPESGTDGRGQRYVGIDIRRGDPVLDALA